MYKIALKMLFRDGAKYLAILVGISFASLLITQQASIFMGLMTRTYGFITDTSLNDIWVMDPKIQFVDDIIPMQDMKLFSVRGVEGVRWATPLFKGIIRAKLPNGSFQNSIVVGIDDATLIGGPPIMVEGQLANLRQSDSIIVDMYGAKEKLASTIDGKLVPLQMGDRLEINDRRAVVVGLCKISRTFQSQPVIYTTYTRALRFAPPQRKMLSFILVKAKEGVDLQTLCDRITERTGLGAYTQEQFIKRTTDYIYNNTGIPINFGVAVLLGFLVGVAIALQTFYGFIQDNLRYFAVFKAMGLTNRRILRMILLQTLTMGLIGYGIGIGLASIFGLLVGTELSFLLTFELLGMTLFAILFICLLSTVVCVRKIFTLEPAIVFRG